jgi:hypothetical protein
MSCVIRNCVWGLIGTALVLGTAWAGPTAGGKAIKAQSPVVRTTEGPVRGIRLGEVTLSFTRRTPLVLPK